MEGRVMTRGTEGVERWGFGGEGKLCHLKTLIGD